MLKLILILCASLSFAGAPKYHLSTKVFDNKDLPFISHRGPGPFDSYLTMEIQFAPIADLFKQLLLDQRKVLTNRGEAHITVLTPVEFHEILKSKLTMDDIDEIARKQKLQESPFTIVCLGEGSLEMNSKLESAYYVVVRSPALLKVREEIQKAWIAKGGDKESFKPEYFYPHITLGYTARDLHLSDGVVKDESTCIRDIEIKK